MATSYKRSSHLITNQEDLDYIFKTTPDDCAKLSLMMECFGDFNGNRRFQPYDIIQVPPNTYGPEGKKNKNAFTTTVGLFIFNRAFIEKDLVPLLGYVNEPVTKKVFGKLNKKISYAVLEDKIEIPVMRRFIQLTQKFQAYVDILSPSYTPAMLGISHALEKKKKELIKKYEKGIQECDPTEVEKLEKELLDAAKEELKDDPAMDMINSGAKASWGNNFKNVFAIRGAYKNSDPAKGQYSVILGNFLDGVSPEEYSKLADSLTGGPYARAKKTEVGGALEKQFVRAFQHVVIDKNMKDCGTKRVKEVLLTDSNKDLWMYSYIVEGGRLVELTSETIDKYIGKRVKLRYSALCEDKAGICQTCAGTLFTRLGIYAVGIASYALASKIKLVSMKSFHDNSLRISKMGEYGYAKIFDNVK